MQYMVLVQNEPAYNSRRSLLTQWHLGITHLHTECANNQPPGLGVEDRRRRPTLTLCISGSRRSLISFMQTQFSSNHGPECHYYHFLDFNLTFKNYVKLSYILGSDFRNPGLFAQYYAALRYSPSVGKVLFV